MDVCIGSKCAMYLDLQKIADVAEGGKTPEIKGSSLGKLCSPPCSLKVQGIMPVLHYLEKRAAAKEETG